MASGKVKWTGLLVGAVVLGVGCEQWPKNGFLDPSQVGRFAGPSLPQNIQNVVSIKDEPLDIEAARDPGPKDLEVIAKDYVIGPGDTVNVTIYELLAEGTESPFLRQVSETGYISLPELPPTKLGGLTSLEAERYVAQQLQQADILRNPRVAVSIIERRHQNWEALGAFVRPGTYQVLRPNFRLMDAISLAGDLQPGIETIYVLRAYDSMESAAQSQPAAGQSPASVSGSAAETTPAAALPGVAQEMPSGPAESAPAAASSPSTAPVTPGVSSASQPAVPTEAEVQGVMNPAGGAATQAIAGQPRKLIAIGDQWVEVPAAPETAPATAEATQAGATGSLPAASAASPTATDWLEAINEAGRQRILRIPVRDLMHGDPRYNVVIRPDDRVYAWLGPVGEFYVAGNVYRPGVFSLTGRRVTVRQAVIAAGGLSPLAWPDRCELVRRYNDSQEEIIQLNLDAIFAGTQPDVVLKPNDVLNVGTNAIAPFMATVRNAFRLTYGFGFVYDRNFADIDSYSAKINPTDIRRSQRQSLFGSLFQ